MVFPQGAFSGSQTFSIRTDGSNPTLIFQPSFNFNKDLRLTVKYSGLNHQRYGLTQDNTVFAYLADNGTNTIIANEAVREDENLKITEVVNARIPHFSRYGFIRKDLSNNINNQQ